MDTIKTLVVHPQDVSTDFLKPIYEGISNKTVITKGNKLKVMDLIEAHDRILMMGHGSPGGLFAMPSFISGSVYIIDDSIAPLLETKTSVFIWCNADQFVERNKLKGFYSGMFVSEVGEAIFCGLGTARDSVNLKKLVKESNDCFSNMLSQSIDETVDEMHDNIIEQYGTIAQKNQVAQYNLDRLYTK